MFYSTHIMFADIIYKNLKAELRSTLKKNSFRYGNIKPDLSRVILKLPHTFEASFDYVLNEIDLLIKTINNVDELNTKEFARRLGVINHYIADYFCLAHNKSIMNEGIIKHLLYEVKINKLCKSNRNYQDKDIILGDDFNETTFSCIGDYINYMHDNYLIERQSITEDISYAVQTCATVTSTIIKMCIWKCKQHAA